MNLIEKILNRLNEQQSEYMKAAKRYAKGTNTPADRLKTHPSKNPNRKRFADSASIEKSTKRTPKPKAPFSSPKTTRGEVAKIITTHLPKMKDLHSGASPTVRHELMKTIKGDMKGALSTTLPPGAKTKPAKEAGGVSKTAKKKVTVDKKGSAPLGEKERGFQPK